MSLTSPNCWSRRHMKEPCSGRHSRGGNYEQIECKCCLIASDCCSMRNKFVLGLKKNKKKKQSTPCSSCFTLKQKEWILTWISKSRSGRTGRTEMVVRVALFRLPPSVLLALFRLLSHHLELISPLPGQSYAGQSRLRKCGESQPSDGKSGSLKWLWIFRITH